MACITCDVFDLALLGSGASIATWPLLVLCEPLSVSAILPFHPWFNPHMGPPLPTSSPRPTVFQLNLLQSSLMNGQEILGPVDSTPEPREAQESYALAIPLITMLGLLIIFDVITSPYPFLSGWCSDDLIKPFLEFFVLEFFTHLPKTLPYL